MRRLVVFGACLMLLSVIAAACGVTVFGERGSGNVVSETRDVSGFDEIALSGNGTVLVSVTGTESLTIEAEDNILPLLTSDVRGGTLDLGSRRGISPTKDIVYTITVVSLEGVSISGSGKVTATDVDAGAFKVDISGSGDMQVSGVSDSLDLSISGSGRYDGEGLVSLRGEVSVSGSGDAVVNVSDDLEIRVSGSGNVEYLNDPAVSISTSGSGNVSKR